MFTGDGGTSQRGNAVQLHSKVLCGEKLELVNSDRHNIVCNLVVVSGALSTEFLVKESDYA